VITNPQLDDALTHTDGLPPGAIPVKFDYAVKGALTSDAHDWIEIQNHFQCCGWSFLDIQGHTPLASGTYCKKPLPPVMKLGQKVISSQLQLRPVLPCKIILINEA
jgi:hypothetical protein